MIIHSKSPRVYEHHEYGSCKLLYDDINHRSWVFVNIPKCASSWMKNVFKQGKRFNYLTRNWEELPPNPALQLGPVAPRKFVVALRDPIERWIVGASQTDLPYAEKLDWKSVIEQTILDNHTEPQISFLNGIDTDNVIWLKVDKNLTQCIYKLQATIGYLRIPSFDDDHENSFQVTAKKDSRITKFQIEARKQIESNLEYKTRLLEVYDRDIELYNSVKFYGV